MTSKGPKMKEKTLEERVDALEKVMDRMLDLMEELSKKIASTTKEVQIVAARVQKGNKQRQALAEFIKSILEG